MSKNKKKILDVLYILVKLTPLICLCVLIVLVFKGDKVIFYASGGCNGIESFYTNTSFFIDVSNFLNSVEYNLSAANYPFRSILEINRTKKAVCKGQATIVYCLGQKYNKTCKLYLMLMTHPQYLEEYPTLLDMTSHMGVACKINKQWKTFV